MSESILDIAFKYIEAGLQCHPCYPPAHEDKRRAGKSPKPSAWQKTRLSKERFEELYVEGDNLGVVTGKASGIICVDIDPRNGGLRWFHEQGETLGNYLLEETGSGGLHLYYKYPSDRENVPSRTGMFPGVDFLADGGRQVVTWPSAHKDGGQYCIPSGLNLLDIEHEYDTPPEWLLTQLGQKKEASLSAEAESSDNPAEIEKVRGILRAIPHAVEGLAGDHRTYRAACTCRDYGLSRETAFLVLAEEFNPRCIPPWSVAELRAKVKNAYRYAKDEIGGATAAKQFGDVAEEKTLSPDAADIQELQVIGQTKYILKRTMACADLFIERQQGKVRFSEEIGYVYDEQQQVWRFLSDVELRSLVERDIDHHTPSAHKALKLGRIKEIAELVKIRLQHERFDPQLERWLRKKQTPAIRVENGVLDIKTNKLEEHTLEWFSFNKLPFNHAPDEVAPHFAAFLRSIWGDDDDVKSCLQLWFGYTLLSATVEQRFALFIGASRAGKGVLTRLIERVLGEAACAACTLTSLAGEFGLESLLGKRLVIFHDAYKAQGSLGDLATERLVSIVGRDRQAVNRKYRQSISCILPINVMMVCNEFPRFVNARGALSNRMLIFPFSESFAGKEDLGLEERLAGELPGIFNWALNGAKRLLAGETLKQPDRATDTLAEVLKQMDPLLAWREERLQVSIPEEWTFEPEITTATSTLYEDYKRWCNENGHHALSRIKFVTNLEHHLPSAASRKKIRTGLQTYWAFTHVKLLDPENSSDFH